MIKIKIHRKKQFASKLVPFYLVFNDDILKVRKAAEDKNLSALLSDKNSGINIYEIKTNQTIVFNSNKESVRVMAINNNFENSKIYPLAFTNELLIEEDKNLLLYQSKAFATVKIDLIETDKIENSNAKEIIEYNL